MVIHKFISTEFCLYRPTCRRLSVPASVPSAQRWLVAMFRRWLCRFAVGSDIPRFVPIYRYWFQATGKFMYGGFHLFTSGGFQVVSNRCFIRRLVVTAAKKNRKLVACITFAASGSFWQRVAQIGTVKCHISMSLSLYLCPQATGFKADACRQW